MGFALFTPGKTQGIPIESHNGCSFPSEISCFSWGESGEIVVAGLFLLPDAYWTPFCGGYGYYLDPFCWSLD
jgi:hypothetical protein